MSAKYIPWKWLVVVIFAVPPIVLILLPTAILRIVFVNLAEWIEMLDDWIHDKMEKPMNSIFNWSKKNEA